MKRQVTIISLLILLVGPAMCTFFFLHHQQKQLRHEVKRKMKAGIPKDQLILLTFSNEEASVKLVWKHSKEFEYNGQMYDIIEQRITADSSFYWCWWDHEETALNHQLNELVLLALQQNPTQKSQSKLLIQFFKLSYITNSPISYICSAIASPNHQTAYFRHYNSIFIPPPSPPPTVHDYNS